MPEIFAIPALTASAVAHKKITMSPIKSFQDFLSQKWDSGVVSVFA
jgi:hypothetical protein